MSLNINIPGVLSINLNGGGNNVNISEMLVVPQPIPKNYGIIS
jgi:hypothetical protein